MALLTYQSTKSGMLKSLLLTVDFSISLCNSVKFCSVCLRIDYFMHTNLELEYFPGKLKLLLL